MIELLAAIAARAGDGVRARICDGLAREATREERAAAIAAWRAPVPPGLTRVHASWLEAALAGLPPRARELLAGSPARGAIDVWLARWACADIPPMPPMRDEPRDPLAWLASVGADQLAFALGDAAARADSQLVRDAAARIARPPRAGQLGSRRAAALRCRDVRPDDDLRYVRIGTRAVAPRLDLAEQRAIVLRLPRAIGLVVDDELRARAADPRDDAPSRDSWQIQ